MFPAHWQIPCCHGNSGKKIFARNKIEWLKLELGSTVANKIQFISHGFTGFFECTLFKTVVNGSVFNVFLPV